VRITFLISSEEKEFDPPCEKVPGDADPGEDTEESRSMTPVSFTEFNLVGMIPSVMGRCKEHKNPRGWNFLDVYGPFTLLGVRAGKMMTCFDK